MDLAYTLIPGGYAITLDGVTWIEQTFQPTLPFVDGVGVPYPDDASATEAAVALIAGLTPPVEAG